MFSPCQSRFNASRRPPQMSSGTLPPEDSSVIKLETDKRVCMLHRPDDSVELFRFSTTEQKWEKLDAGSPPSGRRGHGMVSVGSDLYVFGGSTRIGLGDDGDNGGEKPTGEEGRRDDGHRLHAK